MHNNNNYENNNDIQNDDFKDFGQLGFDVDNANQNLPPPNPAPAGVNNNNANQNQNPNALIDHQDQPELLNFQEVMANQLPMPNNFLQGDDRIFPDLTPPNVLIPEPEKSANPFEDLMDIDDDGDPGEEDQMQVETVDNSRLDPNAIAFPTPAPVAFPAAQATNTAASTRLYPSTIPFTAPAPAQFPADQQPVQIPPADVGFEEPNPTGGPLPAPMEDVSIEEPDPVGDPLPVPQEEVPVAPPVLENDPVFLNLFPDLPATEMQAPVNPPLTDQDPTPPAPPKSLFPPSGLLPTTLPDNNGERILLPVYPPAVPIKPWLVPPPELVNSTKVFNKIAKGIPRGHEVRNYFDDIDAEPLFFPDNQPYCIPESGHLGQRISNRMYEVLRKDCVQWRMPQNVPTGQLRVIWAIAQHAWRRSILKLVSRESAEMAYQYIQQQTNLDRNAT